MNESIQVIERDGQPEFAVNPYAEFLRLRELAEQTEDIRAFDQAVADDGEALPHELMKRLVAG